jgi:hypothetical protein
MKKKQQKFEIKAYGISHAHKLIIGFRTYEAACQAIDMGFLDWAGDRDSFHNREDTEETADYNVVYSLMG